MTRFDRLPVYDFLLAFHSNYGPISHRFRDTMNYWLANFCYSTSIVGDGDLVGISQSGLIIIIIIIIMFLKPPLTALYGLQLYRAICSVTFLAQFW